MNFFGFNVPGQTDTDDKCRVTLVDTDSINSIIKSIVEHVNTNEVLVKGIDDYNSNTSDVKQQLDIKSLVSNEVEFKKGINPCSFSNYLTDENTKRDFNTKMMRFVEGQLREKKLEQKYEALLKLFKPGEIKEDKVCLDNVKYSIKEGASVGANTKDELIKLINSTTLNVEALFDNDKVKQFREEIRKNIPGCFNPSGGRRRSSKPSKKRPTARRRRSSKARKARKARATRRR
jgi:hypothetical protein